MWDDQRQRAYKTTATIAQRVTALLIRPSIALHSGDVRRVTTTVERQAYNTSLTRNGGGGGKLIKPFSCQQPTI